MMHDGNWAQYSWYRHPLILRQGSGKLPEEEVYKAEKFCAIRRVWIPFLLRSRNFIAAGDCYCYFALRASFWIIQRVEARWSKV